MKKKLFFSFVFLIFSVFIYQACDVAENLNLFSTSDDVQLGNQVSNEIRSDPAEYPLYTKNPAVKSYLKTRIFDHILASDKIVYKDVFDYSIDIIDDDDVFNAFALPGGPVYVYTGLMKYLDSEAALAGVIGHEIAHAENRHATERMTKYYGVSILVSIVLGESPSQLAEIAANLFVGLSFLANSRADETESDEDSFAYLRDTRYYPGGVKFFFEKMRDDGLVDAGGQGIEVFLSTHPDPVDRISEIDQRLRDAGLEVKSHDDDGSDFYKSEYTSNILNKL
ncbi:MAG: M48 family metalloprotease [Melioribacteraceae bacterium]|nr:M48 family metalloprotease [Melioribacteraceae bacterium]MCF8353617.1 M48 family metalloprotease [Melioribacteraceae bacterium]MCF8393540.1 M48 family metalloprotease [Melioribacteraceae bacterium]MCF8419350.1 M48 family metalloprotease [Melioribacteraceae bacterium]